MSSKNAHIYYHSDLCGSRAQSPTCLNYAEKKQSVRSMHLGSAAYLTSRGHVTQTLNYLPYGEDWIDVQNTLDPRLGQYTFTGKERDEETGFGYFGARYMDHELMTMWLSVDPMADKYPSISPYAYCAWNPVKLVDPDGLTPRIYVETEGFGHAFVSVEVNGNLIVYTYGRYAGGDKHKRVSGETDPTGKGVLIRLTGDAAQQYINHKVKDNHASAYEFNDASDEKVMQYYDNLFSSGTKLNPHDASRYDNNPLNYGTSDDARVIDQYFLFSNNCVTTSTKGIQKGGSKIRFKTLFGNCLVLEKNIISPSDLKVYLEMMSRYSQCVKKIESPDTISGAN